MSVPIQADDITLRVTEIFLSLQGEARDVGKPTVFVRLTGCPLRCVYCDTAYAFSGGETLTLAAIVDKIDAYGVRYVTVTGGEPLAQRNVQQLLVTLCDDDYKVSLETSGALDVSSVDPRVIKVLDLKCPASGESAKNHWGNLQYLTEHDQVKFVISNRSDYEWACDQITKGNFPAYVEVLFSPVYGDGRLRPETLAEWILSDRLQVRFQIQLHKYLWGDVPGK